MNPIATSNPAAPASLQAVMPTRVNGERLCQRLMTLARIGAV
jgi:hypothetical protein